MAVRSQTHRGRRLALRAAAALAVLVAAFAALAVAGSPILRPLYRYDASHDILPDWLWDHGLPLEGRYKGIYDNR
jgi:hypothetical protein